MAFVTKKAYINFLKEAFLCGNISLEKVLKHPPLSLLSYIYHYFVYFLLKTVYSRFRCQTVKMPLQMQMATLVAVATQHPDLKLFAVRLPW